MDKDLFRLGHIEECSSKIEHLVKSLKTLKSFKENWIEQDSMLRNFEIIGEAANHISIETKERFASVEWYKIRGMRNLVAHEYFGVRLETIWETAVHDIPVLKKQIKEIIAILED